MAQPHKGDRTPVLVRFPKGVLEPIEREALAVGKDRHDIILERLREAEEARNRK